MDSLRKLGLSALAVAAMVFASLSPTFAQTIISQTGNGPGADIGGTIPSYGQFAAVSWTQTTTYDNVSISAGLMDDDGFNPWDGTAYLTNSIGAGAANVVSPSNFVVPFTTSNTLAIQTPTLFSGLTLGPGTYFLVLVATSNLGTNDNTPEWAGFDSTSTSTSLGTGVTFNGDWFYWNNGNTTSSIDSTFPPATANAVDWSALSTPVSGLDFTVTGDPFMSVVPESSSMALILPSALLLTGVGLFIRRRRRLIA